MAMNYIYTLRDPFTLERRYVGKSKDPCDRYRKHLLPYYLKPDTYKNRWLRKVLSRGEKPILEVICEADDTFEDINQIERDFIRWLKNASRLTNGTDGGDGGATLLGRKMPPRGPSPMLGIKWADDDPRRQQIRDRQKGKVPVQATTRATEANRCMWRVTSPDGEEQEVLGLSEFCELNGLSVSKMSAVARGESGRTHHKGWHCEKI